MNSAFTAFIEFTLCLSNREEEHVYINQGICPGHLEFEEPPGSSDPAAQARFAAKRLRWLAERLEDSARYLESKGGN